MHVHPRLSSGRRALAMIFNPTTEDISHATVALDLYYTGLSDEAIVSVGDNGTKATVALARDYSIAVNVTLPAQSTTWVLVEAPSTSS